MELDIDGAWITCQVIRNQRFSKVLHVSVNHEWTAKSMNFTKWKAKESDEAVYISFFFLNSFQNINSNKHWKAIKALSNDI